MREEIIHTTQIYAGHVVKLAVHDVRLPDGKTSRREVVRHSGAAAIIALDNEQNVLLVKQFRLPAGQALYEIPAGTLEPDEAPEVCAIRELQEETGYKPGKIESLGGFFPAPGYTTEFIHLFWAADLQESRLSADADEFLEVQRLPLAEALAMIERGDIIDSKSIIGLLRVGRKLGV
jgi:ADP-ribose pyrophosphatase